jgi:hypothetical protein
MLQVRVALWAQVDNDVEDGATHAANELGLGRGRILKVHAANRTLLAIVRDIGLGDERLQPVCLEFMLAESAGKEAPRIFPSLQVNDKSALELGFRENHRSLLASATEQNVAIIGPLEICNGISFQLPFWRESAGQHVSELQRFVKTGRQEFQLCEDT